MATWSSVAIPALGANSLLVGLGLGGGVMLLAGENGEMRRSADAGASWASVSLPEANSYAGLASDGTTVVAVGYNGTHRVIISTDGGASWSVKNATEAAQWLSVCSPAANTFVAVSPDATNRVMKSTDGGNTWSGIAASSVDSWSFIAAHGSDLIAANSALTAVMVSTDAGDTWTGATAPTNTTTFYAQGTETILWSTLANAFAFGGYDSFTEAPKVAFTADLATTWSYTTLDPSSYKFGLGLIEGASAGLLFLGTPFDGSSSLISAIGISDDNGATFPVTDPGVSGNWPIIVSAWDPDSSTLAVWDETPSDTVLLGVFATPPAITSLSPVTGSAAGNTLVTITGTNLSSVTAVTFGGVAATSVAVVSDTTVTCLSPKHAVGPVTVAVS